MHGRSSHRSLAGTGFLVAVTGVELQQDQGTRGEREMDAAKALERLADRAGIEPFYWDIWGNWRGTSRETRLALLSALGWRLDSDAAICDAAHAEERQAWQALLPPVRVLDERAAPEIDVTLSPVQLEAHLLVWALTLEDGARRSGRCDPAVLDCVEDGIWDGTLYRRLRLALGTALPWGYHRLDVSCAGQEATTTVIVVPARAWCPDAGRVGEAGPNSGANVPLRRFVGLSAQLYGLRSAHNWGLGDYSDLARLLRQAAAAGADVVGLNPLHALFPADAAHFSPYSPSCRRFFNGAPIDPTAIPEFAECTTAQELVNAPAFQAALTAVRAAPLVDYAAVARLKQPVLRAVFQHFTAQVSAAQVSAAGGHSARGAAFAAYCAHHGVHLERQACFEALHAHFLARDPALWSWRTWPEPFQHPESPEVAAFARAHAQEVQFYAFLHWLADSQLADAAATADEAGMTLGLYGDLAVANHPEGAEAWANPGVVVREANVGAPPDHFNPLGQDWGLAPLAPTALRAAAYEPLAVALRANMRYFGALRIDHAMALQHLFWIPSGRWRGVPGAYVRYPFADMLGVVKLESQRHRCMIIGEDLGTVPEGFRPAMEEAGLLAYRVLYFEHEADGRYRDPQWYPSASLATITTHDLPTLKGFWQGNDIQWRDRLGIYPDSGARDHDWHCRDLDRWRLIDALRQAGLLPEGWHDLRSLPPFTPELTLALYRWLGHAPSRIRMVTLEDALEEVEQPNLPGTVTEHPNWRRRLPLAVDSPEFATALVRLLSAVTGQ